MTCCMSAAAEMEEVTSRNVLPRPQRIHHIVEDFLTDFTAPTSHILPLRWAGRHCHWVNDSLASYDADLNVSNVCTVSLAFAFVSFIIHVRLESAFKFAFVCACGFNRRFLEMSLQNDLRHVFAEDCARVMMTHGSAPAACKQYSEGQGLLAGHLTWPFLEEKSLELLLWSAVVFPFLGLLQ